MNPTPESLYYSPLLSNLSVAYIQDLKQYIALRAVGVVPTIVQSATYYLFSKADMNRDDAKEWEDGKEPNRIQLRTSTDTYNALCYALGFDITRKMRDAALTTIGELGLRKAAMRTLTNKLMIRQERIVLNMLFAQGVWTGITGGDQTGVGGAPGANQFRKFSDTVNALPLSTIRGYADGIWSQTLLKPNTIIFGKLAWTDFCLHPQVKDQFKYTSPDSITTEMAAKALDMEACFVAGAGYNSAIPGDPNAAETSTMGFVNANDVWIGYLNRNAPAEMEPSAAYVFGWTNMVPGSPAGILIEELPLEPRTKNQPVQGYTALDAKRVGADLGGLLIAAH